MEPEIAPAGPADAPALARIAAASFDDPWSERAFAEELAQARTRALLARAPGVAEPLGYVLGWRVDDLAEIQSLAVARRWRRHGLGRRLLERYLAELRGEGVARVWLEVRASNLPAQELYAQLGLAREGERPRYYAGGEAAYLFGTAL